MGANITAFVEGLSTFAIGVTMVFIALVLLIVLINIIGKVVGSIEKKETEKENSLPEVEASQPVQVISDSDEVEDDEEVVAVISAAVATMLGTTTDKLQIRSLRQVERRQK